MNICHLKMHNELWRFMLAQPVCFQC